MTLPHPEGGARGPGNLTRKERRSSVFFEQDLTFLFSATNHYYMALKEATHEELENLWIAKETQVYGTSVVVGVVSACPENSSAPRLIIAEAAYKEWLTEVKTDKYILYTKDRILPCHLRNGKFYVETSSFEFLRAA